MLIIRAVGKKNIDALWMEFALYVRRVSEKQSSGCFYKVEHLMLLSQIFVWGELYP